MSSTPNPPPAFQSTTTVWPIQATSNGSKPATEPSTKSKHRNRNRKKAAAAAANSSSSSSLPPPVPSTSTHTKPNAQASQETHRTNMPWRGSGRGRGRGGAQQVGTRGFSTVAADTTKANGGDDGGVKVQRNALFQAAQAGVSRRGVQTDSTKPGVPTASPLPPLSTPSTTAAPNQAASRGGAGGGRGAGRGAGGRGRGRGQPRAPPGGDRGKTLLGKVSAEAGEEDLEKQIHTLYRMQRPSPESVAAREHLISELTDYLNRERFHWGHPHSPTAMPLSIEPFGSIRFGLGTSGSDLDLCLLDPYRPNGFEEKWYSSRKEHMQDLPDIYQMRKLGNSLYRAGLENIHPIPDAAVPICKFEVQIDGQTIQADLNTNERLGVYNSRLLNSYCNLHPLVRPLSVFIKFWASQRGLNNPSGDRDGVVTFSSYTLILLVIAYLQKIKLLPNLQDEELIASTETERSRFFSTPKAYSRRGKLKHLIRSVGWDVTFVEYEEAPEGFEASPVSLVELARGFFHHFGEGFDVKKDVVSIANGEPFARERPFGQPIPRPDQQNAHGGGGGAEAEGEVSKAEQVRQEMEDMALEAFADEEQAQAKVVEGGKTDDPLAEIDAIAQAQSELDEERTKADQARPVSRANSRSSSPIPYGDFSEPEKWTEHMIVVQDPFILTRNCAGNVRPDWVEELRIQMRRARDLIDENAPISKICLHQYSDPDYLPVAFKKIRAKAAEQKKKQDEAMEKRREAQEKLAKEQEEAKKVKAQKEDKQSEQAEKNGDEEVEKIEKVEEEEAVLPAGQ